MAGTISCDELKQTATGDIEIIDVRTPVEFSQLHAEGARNVPLDKLDPEDVMSGRDHSNDRPVYVICLSGSRAAKACAAFEAAGFSNVVNVEGGTQAWEQAGLPVVRGTSKVISLERQVRIAAGALAFLGGVLALTVHPWFAGIPAFVGAGLVFAGVTNTCGMGMMLARMPWNQTSGSQEGGQSSCSV